MKDSIMNISQILLDVVDLINNENLFDLSFELRDYQLENLIEDLVFHCMVGKIESELQFDSSISKKRITKFFSGHDIEKILNIFENFLNHYSKISFIKDLNLKKTLFDRVNLFNFNFNLDGNKIKVNENNKKSKDGVVYTPPLVINKILQNTLEFDLNNLFSNEIDPDLLIKKLLNYKIVDLSCGTGAFLFESLKILKKFYENYFAQFIVDENWAAFRIKYLQFANLDLLILKNNLYGFDIDSFALNLFKICYYVVYLRSNQEKIMSFNLFSRKFNENIKHFNIFNLSEGEIPQFNLVIGNPPYIPWNKIGLYRSKFETGNYLGCSFDFRPSHEDAQPNLYLFFIILSLNFLTEDGKIGFILPNEWLYHEKAKMVRKFLIEQNKDIEIQLFSPKTKLFRSSSSRIGTNSLLLFVNENNSDPMIKFTKLDLTESNQILPGKASVSNLKKFISIPWIYIEDEINEVKNLILFNKNLVKLSDSNYFLVKSGFQPPINEALSNFTLSEEEMNTYPENEKKNIYPVIINSSEIKEYFLETQVNYWIILNKQYESEEEFNKNSPNLYSWINNRIKNKEREKWWEFPNVRNLNIYMNEVPKIISPRVSSFNRFALDFNKTIIKGTNSIIISKKLSYFFLLGIMNSKLANFWYQNFGFSYHGDASRKYEPAKLKEYFIPIINLESDLISNLTKIIYLFTIQKNPKHSELVIKLKKILDLLVYELYFNAELGSSLSDLLENNYSDHFSKFKEVKEEVDTDIIMKFLEKLTSDSTYQDIKKQILEKNFIKIIVTN